MYDKRERKTYYMIDRHGSVRKIEAFDDDDAYNVASSVDKEFKQVGHLRSISPVKERKVNVSIGFEEVAPVLMSYLAKKENV